LPNVEAISLLEEDDIYLVSSLRGGTYNGLSCDRSLQIVLVIK